MIPPWLMHAGLYLAGFAAERAVRAAVQRLTPAGRRPLDLRPVPAGRAAAYTREHPGAMDAPAFTRAALKHLLAHPADASDVLAVLRELARAGAENPGCVIFVHTT